jgi:hypothetical protein
VCVRIIILNPHQHSLSLPFLPLRWHTVQRALSQGPTASTKERRNLPVVKAMVEKREWFEAENRLESVASKGRGGFN